MRTHDQPSFATPALQMAAAAASSSALQMPLTLGTLHASEPANEPPATDTNDLVERELDIERQRDRDDDDEDFDEIIIDLRRTDMHDAWYA